MGEGTGVRPIMHTLAAQLMSNLQLLLIISTTSLLHELAGAQLYIIIRSKAGQDLAPHLKSIHHLQVKIHHCGDISSKDNLMLLVSHQFGMTPETTDHNDGNQINNDHSLQGYIHFKKSQCKTPSSKVSIN